MRLIVAQFYNWIVKLISHEPIHLAIARKYTDANGSFIGELYKYDIPAGRQLGTYRLIGCSLDTLPLMVGTLSLRDEPDTLDVEHDFLDPIGPNTLRVGAIEPKDNKHVCKMIGQLPRHNIRLVIQNRFIEHVLENRRT